MKFTNVILKTLLLCAIISPIKAAERQKLSLQAVQILQRLTYAREQWLSEYIQDARQNNVRKIQYFINSYPHEINADYFGTTLLNAACRNNATETIQLLLKQPHINVNCGALCEACENEDLDTVKRLFNNPNTDVNQTLFGNTPAYIAITKKNKAIMTFLFTKKADLNIKCRWDETFLTVACRNKYKELVQQLFKYPNIDVNCAALCEACENEDRELFTLLLNHPGINVNQARIKTGDTAMHIACLNKNIEFIKLLLTKKPNLNIRNNKSCIEGRKTGDTPIDIAYHYDNEEMMRLLFNQSNITVDHELLRGACELGKVETVKLLLNNTQIDVTELHAGETALHVACKNNNTKLVTLMLEKIPHLLHIKDTIKGETPLLVAARKNINLVNMLLAHGANIYDTDAYDHTVLFLACTHDVISDINQLKCKENDPSNRNNFINNELKKMCVKDVHKYNGCPAPYYNNLNKFITWCIKNGADINIKDENNLRLIDIAEKKFSDNPTTKALKLYHTFLRKYPRCPLKELYLQLKTNLNDANTCKKIMAYYIFLTIDWDMARRIDFDYHDQKSEDIMPYKENLFKELYKNFISYIPNL